MGWKWTEKELLHWLHLRTLALERVRAAAGADAPEASRIAGYALTDGPNSSQIMTYMDGRDPLSVPGSSD